MSQSLKVGNAERRVFQFANFQDGLWDICLGLFLVVLSVYPLTRSLLGPIWNLVLILALMMGLVLVVNRLRLRVVVPRTGFVKFGQRTRRNLSTAHLITLALVLATLALWIFSAGDMFREPTWKNLPLWVSDFDMDLLFAVIIIVIFSLVAYNLCVPRYYLFGVLMAVGNFYSTVLLVVRGVKFQYPLMLAGTVIVVIGSLVLVRFIKTYPIPQDEA